MTARHYFDAAYGVLRTLIRWRWFGVANSVVVLGLLVYLLSHRLADVNWLGMVSRVNPGWIACTLLAAVAAVLATALRTRDVFAREARRQIGLAPIIRLQFIGLFLGFAVPIAFAVDVARVGMYRLRFGIPLETCTRAVVFDRLLGALGIVFVGILTCALQPLFFHESFYLASFQAVMAAAAVLFVGSLIVLSRSAAALRWPLLQVVLRWMSTLGSHFTSPDFLARQALYAILYVGSFGLMLLCLVRAFDFNISTLLVVAFTPLILFVSNLPFLYAGWGGRELIIVVTLSGVGGARADDALVLSITAGLAMLVVALPGAVFWIARPTFRKESAAESAEQLTPRTS